MTVRLNDVDIRMEPDSGAEVNLMDEHQFQALLHRTNHKLTLEHCRSSSTRCNILSKSKENLKRSSAMKPVENPQRSS